MNAEFLLFRAVTASVVPVARHLKEFGPQQAHPEGRHACQIEFRILITNIIYKEKNTFSMLVFWFVNMVY